MHTTHSALTHPLHSLFLALPLAASMLASDQLHNPHALVAQHQPQPKERAAELRSA